MQFALSKNYLFNCMKLNKEWHLAHPMPAGATLDQRIAWHLEHTKNCSCHDMPEKIKAEIAKRKNDTRKINRF